MHPDTPGLARLCLYFLRLGTLGFGGPIALCGHMQRDLVERRGWVAREDYVEGLALAQLAPGPLAAQLAIYIGWVHGRTLGATLVAFAFVLPSFVMVLGLSALYVAYGGLSWMQGVFYGIGAAVIAVIGRSAWKLVGLTIGKDKLLWGICVVSALITAWTQSEIAWVFIVAGLVPVVLRVWPGAASSATALIPVWLLTGLSGPAGIDTLWRIGVYFAEAGAFVFGSGLAIVPFLHGGVVERFHWLTERQFLDAVAVAMITPGPVVITTAFIGYLVAGPAGATVAAFAVFLPCYLFTIIPAPYFRRIVANRAIRAFVDGVTAAATGAIAGSVLVLGQRAIVDLPTAVIAVATLATLVKARWIPEPVVMLVAGVAGLALR